MQCEFGRRALFVTLALLGLQGAWAQSRLAMFDLTRYGVMTQSELSVQHPIPNPPAGKEGYTTAGPPGGIAWSGVGGVVIDSHEHVYVGLPLWTSGAAPRNAARGVGDKLRVLTFTTAGTPAPQHTVDFPTRSLDRLDLRVAPDDTVLVLADDQLMRVGADGRPITRIDIPDQQREHEPWYVSGSNTGRTLRLRLNDNFLMLVDSRTLAVLKRCQASVEFTDEGTMTDDFELTSRSEADSTRRYLARQPFCGKDQTLAGFAGIDFVPTIVDETRFLAVADGTIALRTLTGQTLWSTTAPKDRKLENGEGQPLVSRDGTRVAIRLFKTIQVHQPDSMNLQDEIKGTWSKNKAVQMEDTVGVWDLSGGRLVAQVPLPPGTDYEPNAQFALSPNGHLLAVLKQGKLAIWRLP